MLDVETMHLSFRHSRESGNPSGTGEWKEAPENAAIPGTDRYRMKSTAVHLDSQEIAVSLGQVARYAGGARYRMNDAQRALVVAAHDRAAQLVDPVFVHSVHEVTGLLEGGYVKLHNGAAFPVPLDEPD